MTYHGFEYNKYEVCVNPEIPYRFGKWNQYHFEIKVSETPNGWVYGYDWAHTTGGGGGPCCLRRNTAFLSRSKAVVAAAKFIKKCYKDDPKASRAIAELDRIIKVESEHRHTVRQMTIFDYLKDETKVCTSAQS